MDIKQLKVLGLSFCCTIFIVSILFNIYFYRRETRLEENVDDKEHKHCKCGVSTVRTNHKGIVGGDDAAPESFHGKWPWSQEKEVTHFVEEVY